MKQKRLRSYRRTRLEPRPARVPSEVTRASATLELYVLAEKTVRGNAERWACYSKESGKLVAFFWPRAGLVAAGGTCRRCRNWPEALEVRAGQSGQRRYVGWTRAARGSPWRPLVQATSEAEVFALLL